MRRLETPRTGMRLLPLDMAGMLEPELPGTDALQFATRLASAVTNPAVRFEIFGGRSIR